MLASGHLYLSLALSLMLHIIRMAHHHRHGTHLRNTEGRGKGGTNVQEMCLYSLSVPPQASSSWKIRWRHDGCGTGAAILATATSQPAQPLQSSMSTRNVAQHSPSFGLLFLSRPFLRLFSVQLAFVLNPLISSLVALILSLVILLLLFILFLMFLRLIFSSPSLPPSSHSPYPLLRFSYSCSSSLVVVFLFLLLLL